MKEIAKLLGEEPRGGAVNVNRTMPIEPPDSRSHTLPEFKRDFLKIN